MSPEVTPHYYKMIQVIQASKDYCGIPFHLYFLSIDHSIRDFAKNKEILLTLSTEPPILQILSIVKNRFIQILRQRSKERIEVIKFPKVCSNFSVGLPTIYSPPGVAKPPKFVQNSNYTKYDMHTVSVKKYALISLTHYS